MVVVAAETAAAAGEAPSTCSAEDRARARRLRRIGLSPVEAGRVTAFRGLVALGAPVPVAGIVNGLAFSADGRLLVAAIGHEHRLGGWHKAYDARDGVLFIRLPDAGRVRA